MAQIDSKLNLRTCREEEEPFLHLIPKGWKPAWQQWQSRHQTHRLLHSMNYGCAGCLKEAERCPKCGHQEGEERCELVQEVCRAMGEDYPFFAKDWLIVGWDYGYDGDYPDWFTQEFGSPQSWILCKRRDPKSLGPQSMKE